MWASFNSSISSFKDGSSRDSRVVQTRTLVTAEDSAVSDQKLME